MTLAISTICRVAKLRLLTLVVGLMSVMSTAARTSWAALFILLQLMMPWDLNKFSWPKKMFWATFRFTIRDCS